MNKIEKEVKTIKNSLFNLIDEISKLDKESGQDLSKAILQEGYPFQDNLVTIAHKVQKWHQIVEEKEGLFKKVAATLPKAGPELDQLTADAIFYPIKIKEPTINIEWNGEIIKVPYTPSQNIEHAIHTINVTLREKGYKVRTDTNLIGWEVTLLSPTGVETSVVAPKLEEALCHAVVISTDKEVKNQYKI